MSDPPRIDALLDDASRRLEATSDSPRLDAELLLARAIDMTRSYLFAHPEDTLDDLALQRFEEALGRRLAGEPIAYIEGTKEFWSLELMVTPATLVPRPETELIVDLALREIPRRAEFQILDGVDDVASLVFGFAFVGWTEPEIRSSHIAARNRLCDVLAAFG